MDAAKGLPSLDELTPLTQTLITPVLASAFSIANESTKSYSDPVIISPGHHPHPSSPHFNSFFSFAGKGAGEGKGLSIQTPPAKAGLSHGGISFGPFASNTIGFNPASVMQNGGMELGRKIEAVSLPNVIAYSSFGPWKRQVESSYGGGGGASDSSNGAGGQLKRPRAHQVADGSESEDGDSGGGPENSGEDQTARTLKRPRLVWTPQLHKLFVDAVARLGINNAVPKSIMQLMNVGGLTRENVASHLQKYRLYLKRMQDLTTEGPSLSDQLFASTPIPPALPASPNCLPAQRDDAVAIPFVPPMLSLAYPGLGSAHLGAALAYGAIDRATAQRFAAGKNAEAPSSSPPRPILTLFPTSSH